eukprot:jgi/Botrbrau1/15414/Bobra.43_2s0040.1
MSHRLTFRHTCLRVCMRAVTSSERVFAIPKEHLIRVQASRTMSNAAAKCISGSPKNGGS